MQGLFELITNFIEITGNQTADTIILSIIGIISFLFAFGMIGIIFDALGFYDTNITTIPGDVILYQGNQITIYYDENTWNFTKLGHIDITQSGLKSILGHGDVEVVFSLENKK